MKTLKAFKLEWDNEWKFYFISVPDTIKPFWRIKAEFHSLIPESKIWNWLETNGYITRKDERTKK